MDARKRACLQAMGIDVWERRAAAPTPQGAEAVSAPAAPLRPAVPAEPVAERAFAPPAEPAAERAPAAPVSASAADMDWDALARAVAACTRCPALVANRSRTVFGVGNRAAEWMVIGEAPGADEDRQGEPFVGRAGQLLNAMLQAIGLPRPTVFIANVLKCRPPGNRDPEPAEAANCRPFLTRQIELVNPRLILVVGRIAAQQLLRTDQPAKALRGHEHRHPELGVPMVVTYHPAYLLRQPEEKRRAWEDLRLALSIYRRVTAAAGTAP